MTTDAAVNYYYADAFLLFAPQWTRVNKTSNCSAICVPSFIFVFSALEQ